MRPLTVSSQPVAVSTSGVMFQSPAMTHGPDSAPSSAAASTRTCRLASETPWLLKSQMLVEAACHDSAQPGGLQPMLHAVRDQARVRVQPDAPTAENATSARRAI